MRLIRAERGELVGRLALADGACRAVAGKDDKPSGIRGVSAPYESWTVLYDSPSMRVREQYKRGCFGESLKGKDDIRCMFNHRTEFILGRRAAGTLRLADTDEGLEYEVEINAADPMAMGVYARVARGDVGGASCWFRPTDVQTNERRSPDGKIEVEETIVKAELYECGPVTDGQYTDATAVARGIMQSISEASYKDFMRAVEAAGG